MSFDGLKYTRDALAEELALTERHARDGSAAAGGCACIEEKHLLLVAGLSSEGVTLATDQQEREYYMGLAELARNLRKEILEGDFKRFPSHGHRVASATGNPRARGFLPHGLTECEKAHPAVQAKLSRCIQKAEIKCCGKPTTDYSACTCNPVAVCRAAIPCP